MVGNKPDSDLYCPVHDIKCEEMTRMQSRLDNKLPIWVFKIFIGFVIIAFSAMNAYFYRMSSQTLNSLERHVSVSNTILKKVSQQTRETQLNQKIIMEKFEIPYREIPKYYGGD